MGLENEWAHLATQRDKWHSTTEEGVKKWEAEKNAKAQMEYEQKKAGIGVKCPHCRFIAKNEKGLKSHFGQKHKYVKDLSDNSGDGDDADDDDKPSRSSSSSSTTSKYTCAHCRKDCSTRSGLSSHLNNSGQCKAAAETSCPVKKKAS